VLRLLAIAATLAVLAGLAGPAAAKAPPVRFAGCLASAPAFKPLDVLLACGDGNAAFSVARWTRWTRQSAKALGSAEINDCDPSCVGGHFHSQLAALVLDRPRSCHGARRFTRLRLVFATRPARGQPAPVTYGCRR
jgi:hypothetical protein